MSTESPSTRSLPYEPVNWDTIDDGARIIDVSPRTIAFLLSLLALVALLGYDVLMVPKDTLPGWDFTRLDWLFVAANLVIVFYLVVPAVQRWDRTKWYWQRFRSNRAGLVALIYIVGWYVITLVSPAILGDPNLDLMHMYQPPTLFTVPDHVAMNCLGPVSGGQCQGTLQYPLGSNGTGAGTFKLIVEAMKLAFLVGLVAGALMVPIAVAVGSLAGYLGGWVDELLMRYVAVQQAVPAVLIYIIVMFLAGKSLFLLIVVFGLLNWGGVARLVRSEVIRHRNAGYVMAAQNAGAGNLHVLGKHVLPNVSGTVVTAITRQIPMLILIQVGLAYVDLNKSDRYSFGKVLAFPFQDSAATVQETWWLILFPAIALAVLVVSFNVLGDALYDTIDPRRDV
ncbi:MAG: peptide/nickel transport system permease protein [Halobacteriales archaeon]|jgi:peptide/nickel transport system permease protein